MEQQTMDRRNFLKGALATGALAAGGAMLAGCSPAQPKDAASAGTAIIAAAAASSMQVTMDGACAGRKTGFAPLAAARR